MRLQRLDLTRYGKFTDHSLDFGPRVAGRPDLHIVYGPNEAGKSTALSAILDLLYGIEMRSRYGFLHPYATMRIGAVLETAGVTHTIARLKRPKASLLGPGDRPISEGVILADLGALDRASYQAMFSLDDDTLEQGGESILASKGDLGQLLFSATAGLAEMSRMLEQIRTRSEDIHKPYARSSELAKLRDELAALKDKRERIDTLAPKYAALVDARDAAGRDYQAALDASGATRVRLEMRQRQGAALPRLAKLSALRHDIAALADVKPVPAGWAEDLPGLQRAEIEQTARLTGLRETVARIEAERTVLLPDDAALAIEADFARLDTPRARHKAAGLDLPARRGEMRDAATRIAAVLEQLDQPAGTDPASLLLKAAPLAALRGLIASHSGIAAALAATDEEHQRAIRLHRTAQLALTQAEANAPAAAHDAMDTLKTALPALRRQDHALRDETARRAIATASETLAAAMAALPPWSGDPAALAALTPPPAETIAAWTARLATAERDIARHEAEIERLGAEAVRLRALRDAMSRIAGLVGDGEANAIRGQREALWAAHRRSLDAASADGFEAALRRDDAVMAARLGHQADIARLHTTEEALVQAVASLDNTTTLRDEARAQQRAVQAEIDAAARAISPDFPPRTSPAGLGAWLARRDVACAALAALRTAQDMAAGARTARDAAFVRLGGALRAAGVSPPSDADWDTLLATAETAIAHHAELSRHRAALHERQSDIDHRADALQKAVLAERSWQTAWAKACAACWLGAGPTLPTPAEAAGLLSALDPLGALVQDKTSLARRITDMEADRAAFAGDIAALAARLGIAAAEPEAADDAIARRLAAARTTRDTIARLDGDLATARDAARKTAAHLDLIARRTAEMTGHFGVETLIDVGTSIAAAQAREQLEREAQRTGQEILEGLGLPDIAAAEAALAGLDREGIEAEIAVLRLRLEGEDQRSRDLHTAHAIAVRQIDAVGGDDEVARIEAARRTVLLEIEDKARQHIRLQAGVLAAERALRAYRDTHRGAMMQRASEAFRLITRNAYRGLSTQPDKGEDVLIAVAADGASKLAADLSKGTRFQLYLALRAAGYHAFAAQQPAVPFIADDIMETFDDVRAEETFRLLAAMAGVGQVIYLTHHQHLCDIAQRTVEGVRLHRLPG